MKKNLLLVAVSAALLFTACKSKSDKEMPNMAADLCNCMNMLEKGLSADARDMIIKAGSTADPQAALTEGIKALPADKMMTVANEMMGMAKIEDESSEVGSCMKRLTDKYKNLKTFDSDKTLLKKMIAALEEKKCPFAVAIMKMGGKEKKLL